MSKKQLSFGVFTDFGPADWESRPQDRNDPWTGKFYVEIAQTLEKGNFDFLFFADGLTVADTYGGNVNAPLKLGFTAPLHDPAPLAAVIGASTQNIGVVITMSTLAYHPYTLARLSTTIDHICGGRFGWNIVTSTERGAARNYGMDDLPPRQARYEMADDYMGAFDALVNSWDADAVVMDRETGTYADGRKVHEVNYAGPYYKTAGPLNTSPSPQRRPLCFQAGASPAGRSFAARHADCIIAEPNGLEAMKNFMTDMRQRRAAEGRDPESLKVFFLVMPVIGRTPEEAREKLEKLRQTDGAVMRKAVLASTMSNIDFAKFDLDAPIPTIETQGGSGTVKSILGAAGSEATLREALIQSGAGGSVDLVGTADEIADRLLEIAQVAQPDGFLFVPPLQLMNSDYARQLTEQLAPALQKRGLMSAQPKPGTLKQKLGVE